MPTPTPPVKAHVINTPSGTVLIHELVLEVCKTISKILVSLMHGALTTAGVRQIRQKAEVGA